MTTHTYVSPMIHDHVPTTHDVPNYIDIDQLMQYCIYCTYLLSAIGTAEQQRANCLPVRYILAVPIFHNSSLIIWYTN